MKKNQITIFAEIIFIFLFSSTIAAAQKLPNIQKNNLRAPANIKIDGNTIEWGDKFQAYNKAINVFYTVANDDSNLYFVIKATEPDIIYKIINGGITLTISNSKKRGNTNDVKISYPLFGRKNLPSINLKNKPIATENSSRNIAQADSFKNALNEQLEKKSKEIKVLGIKTISDSLVSVYNQYGILSGERFDDQLAYVYEIAIPTKFIPVTNNPIIYYNIKINGRVSVLPARAQIIYSNATASDMNTLYSTDFWGQYLLPAKAQ